MANYTLKIECNSAVCPASGETWGGVVDNDVIYDDIGIPFIPAKRLKGLLVESAMDVCYAMQKIARDEKKENWNVKNMFDLFGLDGNQEPAPIIIDDAKIDQYDEKRAWLAWAQNNVRDLASPMQVLSLFTTLRAQTSIGCDDNNEKKAEDEILLDYKDSHAGEKSDDDFNLAGISKPHSLRVQRVLRRGLVFESKIQITENINKQGMEYKSLLVLAAAATQHIGLNRNRGMGDVTMRLLENSSPIDVKVILNREVSHVR